MVKRGVLGRGMVILRSVWLLGLVWLVTGGVVYAQRMLKRFPLENFTEIDLRMKAQVSVTQGKDFYVRAEAGTKEMLEGVEATVQNGVLVLKADHSLQKKLENTKRFPALKLQVTLPLVTKLRLQGNGEILLTSSLALDSTFVARVEGRGNIKLLHVNTPSSISLEVNGSGEIATGRLKASQLRLSMRGNGDIRVEDAVTLSEEFIAQLEGLGSLQLYNVTCGSCDVQLAQGGDMLLGIAEVRENLHILLDGTGEMKAVDLRCEGDVDVQLRGGGSLECRSMQGRNGKFNLLGSGDLLVRESGSFSRYEIDFNGSGELNLLRVEASDVEVRGKGSGDLWVHATSSLLLRGVEQGMTINYRGDGCIRLQQTPSVTLNKK